jgi:hypothetical protein
MTGVSVLARLRMQCNQKLIPSAQTPLNNNIRELFNLMNFLDPEEWGDLKGLETQYEELNDELVNQLHERLRPYFLRRVKAEVLDLPPKVTTHHDLPNALIDYCHLERSDCPGVHGFAAERGLQIHSK